MIILDNIKQLHGALTKAAKANPKVTIVSFGEYVVTGSHGGLYTVKMKLDVKKNRIVFCSCEEKYPRKQNTACYHIAAALGIHILVSAGAFATYGDPVAALWTTYSYDHKPTTDGSE